MISKGRSRRILVGVIACAIVCIGLSLPTYFIQRQGVCLTAGRVLSSEELHRAFLVDVVNDELRTSYNINWKRGNDYNWAGIADLAGKPDLLEMVKTASSNDKSFEENFGLEVLLKGRNGRIPPATIKAEDLPERFMFVGYQVFIGNGGGGAAVYLSDDIQEIPFSNLRPDYRASAERKISFLDRLRGFGNHFFLVDPLSISVGCCDNRDKDLEEYEEYKRSALNRTLSGFKDVPEHRAWAPRIVFASNCGKLMTRDVVATMEDRMRYAKEHPETQAPSASDNAQP